MCICGLNVNILNDRNYFFVISDITAVIQKNEKIKKIKTKSIYQD